MLRYIQRSTKSMSTKSIPRYFDQVMNLHRAKTRTFLALSHGTHEAERRAFCSKDLRKEVIQTVDRFPLYPGEEENLPAVNDMIFRRFPALNNLIRERTGSDPDRWYLSQPARKLVSERLDTFYDREI